MDPRPLTLREIAWAASERRSLEGELAAVQMSWLASKFNGEQIDPRTLNPYPRDDKPQIEPVKSQAQQIAENAAGWGAIESWLHGAPIKQRF